MTLRKIHSLTPWTVYSLARMRSARRIKRYVAQPAKWGSLPPPPKIRLRAADGRIVVAVDRPWRAGQLGLSMVGAKIENYWRITNAFNFPSILIPFRLFPFIGSDAFTYANSWRTRIYPAEMRIERQHQRNQRGFDALAALLLVESDAALSIDRLLALSVQAIGSTLTGQEQHDFWMSQR